MKKKLLVPVLCILMMLIGGFATWAYLTDTEDVTNTFSVGDVQIKLDEAVANTEGVATGGRTEDGNDYHLLPGHTYVKDPTVTVLGGSEDTYVRMLVTVKNIDKLILALPDEGETAKYYADYNDGRIFLLQMLCNGWDANTWQFAGYTASGNDGTYEFRYNGFVPASAADTPLDALFDSITVPGEIDNTHLAYLDAVDILVVANAIQADGFEDDQAEAWTKF